MENRDEEIYNAKISKEEFKKYVRFGTNILIYAKFGKFDKYGRILTTLYINNTDIISVNDLIVTNGYGKEYFGGKK